MSVDTGKELFRLGFLTAIEIPDRGYVGGLLVTNHFGRPLEFQCTAPLKPNRTQEILYGPTLVPYVLGDLIGRTLIEKVGVKPHLVLTEREELLGLRELVEIPVACVEDLPANAATATAEDSVDEPEPSDEKPELTPAEPPVVVVQEPADPLVDSTNADSKDSSPIEMRTLDQSVLDSSIREPALNLSQIDAVAPPADAGTADTLADAPLIPPAEETVAPIRGRRGAREKAEVANESEIQLGRQVLRFHASHADDRSIASRGARVVPNNADLREPFERVREALGETARVGAAR